MWLWPAFCATIQASWARSTRTIHLRLEILCNEYTLLPEDLIFFCDPFCDSIERTNWANQHASRSSRHIWVWLRNKHAALHGHELEHPAACHCLDGQRQQPYLPTFEGGAIITGTGRAKENLYELVEHCVWLKPGMRISSSCCQFRQRLHQMTH